MVHRLWTDDVEEAWEWRELRLLASLAGEPRVLGGAQRDHGQAALAHQRGIGEKRARFDFGERLGLGDCFSGFNFNNRSFRISDFDGNDRGSADGALFIAAVVDDQFIAGFHVAEISYGGGIGNAVPLGLLVAFEIAKRSVLLVFQPDSVFQMGMLGGR